MSGTGFHRPRETDLLPRQVIQNGRSALCQFGVKIAIGIDHRFCDLGEEWFVESDLCAEASRATDDHPCDVIAACVAGNNAICNQERR